MTSARFFGLFTLVALTLTACNTSITFGQDVDAVGDLVTVPFEVEPFDSIAVSNTFEAFVEIGEPRSVEIIVNESVVDELDIRVRNGELKIGLKNGISINNGTLEANIRIPALAAIDVSGASSTDISGVDARSLDIDLSGASDLVVSGTATTVRIDGSGASTIDVRLESIESAIIDLSGASSLELRTADMISGDMSGASSLIAPTEAQLNLDTSGASSISRR